MILILFITRTLVQASLKFDFSISKIKITFKIQIKKCHTYRKDHYISRMKANDYQKLASRTIVPKPDFEITPHQVMASWWAIGLTGEAGEVADLIKKGIYHQQGIDQPKLKKELGDVMWYLSALCTEFGFTLEEVMQQNIDKLKARFPEGYDPERTTFRDGEAS